jgi:Tfp pilus assembly protein PilO
MEGKIKIIIIIFIIIIITLLGYFVRISSYKNGSFKYKNKFKTCSINHKPVILDLFWNSWMT